MATLLATSSTDPWTQVYCALWDMLEAHSGFTGLVRVGNRIKFLGAKLNPLKKDIQDADLPEVVIVPTEADPHIWASSGQSQPTMKFDVRVSSGELSVDVLGTTGTLDIGAAVYPVCWEIWRAMHGWGAVLKTLRWPVGTGKPFVILGRPTGLKLGTTDADLNRGIFGWSAVWTYEVQMAFDLTAVMPS